MHSRLLTAALAAAAAFAAAPRGVPGSLALVYGGATFTCLDRSRVLDASAVNDDFCDCADGSDEPGTSACPAGRFWCVNKGYKGRYVPSSLVNDGVCDCCDGSDEHGTKAGCRDTCDADGAAWRKERQEAIRKAEEGAAVRQRYAAAGQKAAADRVARLAAAASAVDAARVAREAKEKVRLWGGGGG